MANHVRQHASPTLPDVYDGLGARMVVHHWGHHGRALSGLDSIASHAVDLRNEKGRPLAVAETGVYQIEDVR